MRRSHSFITEMQLKDLHGTAGFRVIRGSSAGVQLTPWNMTKFKTCLVRDRDLKSALRSVCAALVPVFSFQNKNGKARHGNYNLKHERWFDYRLQIQARVCFNHQKERIENCKKKKVNC